MAPKPPSAAAKTGRQAIDCGAQIKHQTKAFDASVNFLKAAGAKFGLSTKKIDSLSSEGEVLSETLMSYCQLYKVTDETAYPTSEYRKDIGAIGDWQVKIASFANDVHTGAAGAKKPDSDDKKKKASGLDELIDGAKSLIDKGKNKTKDVTPAKKTTAKKAPSAAPKKS
jgi:hypothetical protein